MPLDTTRKIAIALPSLGDEEWEALREPITTGWLTQGPKVADFERQFAAAHDCSQGIATTSCTTALHLSLVALGIGPGDEVIVPAFTWVATANVVLYCGARPVFVDIDPQTYNIDPGKIAAAITDRTKAVIAVHLFGLCADMTAITDAAGGLPVIEDAACAAGAIYRGRPAGSLGVAGCFSFHPRKSITTGEGGMITTNDEEFAARMQVLRNHGASVSEEQRHHGPQPHILPDFNLMGFNYRMTDLQGAVGIVQLSRLEGFLAERRRRASEYGEALADIPWLRTPTVPAECDHAWQAYVCHVDPARAPRPRNELMQQLLEMGVSTRPGTHSVPHLGYFRETYGLTDADFPVAHDCDRNTMAIPLHNRMQDEDYAHVVEALHNLG